MSVEERILSLPCWSGVRKISPLAGGLSNESFVVIDAVGHHVVRFGVDYPVHHVDRGRELAMARAAHSAGFAPRVEFSEAGVMVSEFIEAATWTEDDMRANPERLARLLHAFHNDMPAHVSGAGFMFWVFHVIRDYARTLEKIAVKWADENPRFLSLCAELETAQVPLPIIFGHNDLLAANILDDGDRLWLIDFEYAGFSTALFDLAGAASNSGMDESQAHDLLTTYFGEPPSKTLLRAFEAMKCASLLREAMWAMVSETFLNTPGVDFKAYAIENLSRLDKALDQYRSKYGKTRI